jgi:hypothetical protein
MAANYAGPVCLRKLFIAFARFALLFPLAIAIMRAWADR